MQNVRVEKLVKKFGDVVAVDGVSFEVPKGKLLTLLGPSGCGKTTTLNIIAGFETPDSGDVHVGDRLISSASENVLVPAHKRNLGMVFQSYGLWPHLKVRDNVAFGLQMRKTPRNEIAGAVERALGMVRLDGLGERYPSQLSGGQQQRVAFARALVYEARRIASPTNPFPISMRRCARRCAWNSRICKPNPASPPYSSPTIRSKPWS